MIKVTDATFKESIQSVSFPATLTMTSTGAMHSARRRGTIFKTNPREVIAEEQSNNDSSSKVTSRVSSSRAGKSSEKSN